jgi:DNA-binding MarR family transcriptional regulator
MAQSVEISNARMAILEAMGQMGERENSASDIAAAAKVPPVTITRELTALKDMKPALVQLGAGGLWVRTQAGEDAVLEDTLDDER